MKHKYLLFLIALSIFSIYYSCSDDDSTTGDDSDYVPVSPVTVDLTKVPYAKLSDYKFFEGDMKNQKPSLDVIPFEPRSTLFTDYAKKKRFVWIPKGVKATYSEDGKVLELPVGSVLIKNFYYTNVQPNNTIRIIETRVMIRKASGWIFANYVWNDAQTEAFFDLQGSITSIQWKDNNNVLKSTDYRIPEESQCIVCHKSKTTVNNVEITKNIPIGIKPQNLNFNYNYGSETKNQLQKWIDVGYLENNFSLPSDANSVVDYNDQTKSLEKRVRSYFDSNCAHCHNDERHCDYRPMKFAFNKTGLGNGQGLTNLGVCVDTQDMQGFPSALEKIVTPGNTERSMLYFRVSTNDETYRMPLHGRTMVHDEGVSLIEQWINSIQSCP